jgi:LysM repeat protein
MKILQIFGWVVGIHLAAFLAIFASPGCQSGPRNIPTPDATAPTGQAAAPIAYNSALANPSPVDLGTPSGPAVTYAPANDYGHATPTRPGSPAAAAVIPVKATTDVAPVSTYTIAKGDNLWNLAKKNNLTVSELAKVNNLSTGATLQPGKKLIIPGKIGAAPKESAPTTPATGKTAAAAARPTGDAVRHTVQPGESLGIIARKYQVTTGELAAANSITDPSKVRAGQQLIIPGFRAVANKGTPTAVKPAATAPATATAPAADKSVAPATPHFEIAPPPPGQDLDSGLKETGTEVPTIKVEPPPADQPPRK